jgi:hypothetical protein
MKTQVSQPQSNALGESRPADDPGSSICQETVRLCVDQCGSGLRAIILTGSLARDEGTFVRQSQFWRVMGDAEFVLVFKDRARVPNSERIAVLRLEVEHSLASKGVLCEIGLSAVNPTFLTGSRPHIFSYELKACGRVAWGEPKILALIPDFQPSDIPLEDAWRLLQNRIVEMLEFPRDFEGKSGALPAEVHYRTVKLYLDMATSLLLFAGGYSPGYREREKRLSALFTVNQGNSWPFPMEDFVQQVAACTEWKLGGGAAFACGSWDFWEGAIAHARQLWRWELVRLTSAEPAASDQKLFAAWMKKQPRYERLRGWLYALRNQGYRRSWQRRSHWARHLWRASPRYWIYAAASELLFRLPEILQSAGGPDTWEHPLREIRAYLPLQTAEVQQPPKWKDIASEIWSNYARLLIETRI